MGQFQVQMPDGTTKSVQGTTLAAAVNNAGPGASAPGSGGGGSVSVQSAPQQQSSGGGGGGSAPAGTFNTKNGTQTVQTMAQQLQAVGWGGNVNDAAAVAAAYASTTGAPVTQGSASPTIQGAGGGSGGSSSSDAATAKLGQIANQMTQALAAGNQAAFDEAVREYNQNFGLDTQKFQASVDQFNQTNAQNIGALTGTFQGQPTLASQAQSGVMANGQPTLAAQTQQQTAANQYLTLLSTLRGPANAFQYAKTLAGTPNGLTDIVNSAAGRYQLGGPPSGAVAAPASLNNLLTDVNNPGAVMSGGPGGAPLDPNALKLPPASQIDSRAYNTMLPSQRDLLWGAYEYGLGPSGAMMPADAQTAYANSLPRYAPPTTGSFLAPASGGAARSF